ncbi:MAG TPA: nitronate monooxygenase, partial [Ilumatobacteraceae bacterium]|nr:nitronate monooxygenase [Ilumatobacteraceae bacterium]
MGNRLCELLGIEIPIVQAPMTFLANATLAAAVSNGGGLGVIETASPSGRDDVARVHTMTDKPVAANIALQMWPDLDGVLGVIDLLSEAGIRLVTTSAGDPRKFTERLHAAGITVLHVIGSLNTARKAIDAGVDGLIVEGVEGGGFKNERGPSTMVLLPLVAETFDVPLVAAGGICDGRSMAAAMTLGADGVQMGTRFLMAAECPAHPGLKQAIAGANEVATRLVPLTARSSMRVLDGVEAERIANGQVSGGSGLTTVQRLYF